MPKITDKLPNQNAGKDKRADELILANEKLAVKNKEKDKRAEELALANKELAVRNKEERLLIERENVAEEMFHLIDSLRVSICRLDSTGQCCEWNRASEELTGYSKEEIVGNREALQLGIPEDQQKYVREMLSKALIGQQVEPFEIELITKQGNNKDIFMNVTTDVSLSGEIIGVLVVSQDISLLKEKEFARQQAQKMQAVGQLTSGLAHDFNNLLSIIEGNLRFLQEDIGKTGDDIKLLFEDALSAVEDGAQLTGRLLRFSSNENSRNIEQGVNVVVEKFFRLISRSIGEKISLDLKLAQGELFVRVDPSQLENSLLNLVINARDAMPNRGKISITTKKINHTEAKLAAKQSGTNELKSQEFVKISVRDWGEGIEPDILSQITEPFFTTKVLGTGLGLSMVHNFLKASDGFLRIDSKVGVGTVIEMYFPKI